MHRRSARQLSAGGESRIDTSGSRLLRLYERLGWGTVPYLFALVYTTVALVMTLVVAAIPVFGYLDGNATAFWTTYAMGAVSSTLGAAVGAIAASRRWDPARRWLTDPGSAVRPEEAWESAVTGGLRATLVGAALAAALCLPAVMAYWISTFDLGLWEAIAAVAGGSLGVAGIAMAMLSLGELLTRPVVAQIAAELPPAWRRPRSPWTVRPKVIASFLILAMASGVASGALVANADSGAGALALAVVGALVAGGCVAAPLMLLATGTILGPLGELRAGTARVTGGDLSTPIPVTTTDEFGDVAESFNRMLEGLRERERLAGEKAALLDEVQASRARIIAASDAERRRVERNIHDGAQQRLVALSLELRMLEAEAGAAGDHEFRDKVAGAGENLSKALGELRELARGLHPQILTTDGLGPAIEQLAERGSLPVSVEAPDDRFPDAVESTAYFVVSEALANVGKYAQASQAQVSVERRNGALHIAIEDDGIGGADPDSGSGLSGLRDRVAALDGRLDVESRAGSGTRVYAHLPLGGGS